MKKYKKLTIEEREKLAIYKAKGKSLRDIARLLNRSHSTLSREIKNNSGKAGDPNRHIPISAQRLTGCRRRRAGRKARLSDPLERKKLTREKSLDIGNQIALLVANLKHL